MVENKENLNIDNTTGTKERLVGGDFGQVKWFDNKLGYGFVTVLTNSHKGEDIFVHQTNVFPLETEFRTLMKGEYVSLNVSNDEKIQALNVTGVLGGSLRCDEPRQLNTKRSVKKTTQAETDGGM